MTKSRRFSRRGPVVLNDNTRRKRRRVRTRDTAFLADTVDAPLPGQILVMLSKLHRAEVSIGPDEKAR